MVTLLLTVPSQCFSTNDKRQHWLQSLGPSVHSMEVLPLITPHTELSVLTIRSPSVGVALLPEPAAQPVGTGKLLTAVFHTPALAGSSAVQSEADMHVPSTDSVGTRL